MDLFSRLIDDFQKRQDPVKARILSRFFKTGKGEYGEGDSFWDLTVPKQRQLAKKYANLGLDDLQKLLESEVHEHRLTALLILIDQFVKADENQRAKIFNFYLQNTQRINNWDLVDLSAPSIVGEYLFLKEKSILFKLAQSKSLWERRIGILATYSFIKKNQFGETLKIAEILLDDKHDLIHKAVGWMLREVGKRGLKTEEDFLKKHATKMPKTMLRYAIEKFSEEKRKFYLGNKG